VAVRIRYKLEVSVSSTTAEDKDLGNHSYLVIADGATEGGSRKVRLAAGATDVEISMNEIATAKLIAIRTNAVNANSTPGTIELKKNAIGGEVIEIVPMTGASEGHMLLSTDSVTALYASNPGSVDMEFTLILVGD
jgi:tRNA G26 N,N-dimethylase Trm1